MNAKTARPGARRLLHTVALLAAWGLSAMAALPFAAQAQSVALSWNRNAETNLTAYVLKYGTTSGSYTGQVSVATNLLTTTVNSVVAGRTYYFVLTARNTAGLESLPSTEVSALIPRTGTNAVPVAIGASTSTAEDTAKAITLTGSDADADPLTFAVVANPANGTLSGTAPALTYTPAANYNGSDSFTFRVNDGQTNSAVATVAITVTAVNDAPTLNALANLTLATNAGLQTVSLSGIGSGAANESQTLAVTASSSNTGLLPQPAVTYTTPGASGQLTFTPTAGASGSATVTVTVNDGQPQNATFTRSFVVTVGAPPVSTVYLEAESGTEVAPMASVADTTASGGSYVQSTTDETGTATLTFTAPQAGTYVVWCRVLSVDGGSDSLYLKVDNGAEEIFDTALGGPLPDWQWTKLNGRVSGNPWLLTLTQGSHTLVFRSRESLTKLDALTLSTDLNYQPSTTTGPNRVPTLGTLANVTLTEDAGVQTVNLTGIGDGDTTADQALTVTATSSNPGLVPNPAVNYTSPNATGTLTFTPTPGSNGTATVSVTVDDGQLVSNRVTRTFTVTVTPVNDPPTLDALANMALNESASQQTVTLSGIGSGGANESQTLTVTATSSATGLIPTPTVTYTSPAATGTLRFTPVGAANGTATITVTVNDGQSANNLVTRTFQVTVSGVNDAPTLNALANVTVNEDAPEQTVNLAGISSGAANEVQTLAVSATSSNPALIPTPTVVYTSPAATGTLRFTPAPNASGTATLTVTVNDGGALNNTTNRSFTVTVNPVNDAPTLDALANVSVGEDSPQQTVNLTGIGTGAANEAQTLVVTATSSNPGLIPTPAITYQSPDATGTLRYTPTPNSNGTATITVAVSDGQAANSTVSRTFTVTVNGVNDRPTLTAIANQTIAEGGTAGPLAVTVSDSETAAGSLTLAGSSSNTLLVPNANITFGGSGANRTVTARPVAGQFGNAALAVVVSDANGGSATQSFTLTVTFVNDPPTLTAPANLTVNEDAGQQTVTLAGIGSGDPGVSQTLAISAVSSNPSLIPNPTVSYSSPNTTGVLTFTPAANANGSATVTVTVDDGQATGNLLTRSFIVTVTPVNDPPTLDPLTNVLLNESPAQQTVNLTGITSGAANEAQTLTVTASSSATTLIPTPTVTYSSPGGTGTLRFTPAAGVSGTATLTVTVNDGQTANNTVVRTFLVTVTGVNDPPTIDVIPNVTVAEDAAQQTVSLTGITSGAANEAQTLVVSAISGNSGLIPNPTVVYTSPAATGSLRFTPAQNANGTATITVTVNDGAALANTYSRSFTVTVTPVNDPPTLDAIANFTVAEDSPVQTVPLTGIGSGAGNESQVLSITASSSNPSLIPTPTVTYGSPDATGTLSFRPATNANGTATITVTVNDGQAANSTFSRAFTVTVIGSNDQPTLSPIADQTIGESGTAGPLAFTVADLETAAASLTLSGSSANTALVPNANITFGGSGANRTVTVRPVTGQVGSSVISVQVADASGGTATRSFNLTVTFVNDAPTLTALGDLTLAEDAGQQTVSLAGIGDGDPGQNQPLSVRAVSSNPGLIPDPVVSYSNPNATGTLTFTPVPNGNGTAILTVTVDDGQAYSNTLSRSFTVTVSAVNDAPTLDALTPMTIGEDAGTQTVPLTGIGSGAANENQVLTVTASSSQTGLIPTPTVTYASPGTSGTLTFRSVTNATGTALLTVTVSDGQGANSTVTRTFLVTVQGVNDAPTISDIPNQTVNEGSATAALPFTVADAETPVANLVVTASSSQQTLVPNGNILLGGAGANRTVTVTPAPGEFGTAVITVQVSDGAGGFGSDSFTLTVASVNQAPTLNPIGALTINEDAGVQTVPLSGISSGGANENQTLTVTATSSNPGLIPAPGIQYTSPSASGALTFAPVANQNGTATVTVTVDDGQVQSHSVVRTFVVTVNAVNDPPTVTDIANQTISQNTSTPVLPVTIGDVETAAASLSIAANSSNPTLVPNSGLVLGGSGANRTLRVTPALNQFGTAVITVTVADGNGGVTSDSFVLTVNTVNFPPTLDPFADVTVAEDAGAQTVPLTGVSDGSASEAQDLVVTAVSSNPNLVPDPVVNYTSPSANGTLILTPRADANGQATITVTLSDGQPQNGTVTRQFTVNVVAVNDAPTLDPIANVSFPQDSGNHTVGLSGISSGASNEPEQVTVTATSSNPSLIPDPVVSYFNPNTSGTLTLSPLAGADGSATITVTVTDGRPQNNIVVRTFTVRVIGGNDPPTISEIPDFAIPMNGIASPIRFTIGDDNTPVQNLKVVATSSNPDLIWTNNIVINGTGADRTASAIATVGHSGYAVITFTVYDTDGASASESFIISTVKANVQPTLDPIASFVMDEDSGQRVISLTGITAGSPEENQNLIVTAFSSTPGVIPHPVVTYTSPQSAGILTLEPLPDVTGSATITVRVDDGQTRDNLFVRSFGVIVQPVNDAPTISSIPNQVVEQGTPTGVLPFLVDDQETPIDSLRVTASSSNPTLIPNGNIALAGAGANRSVRVAPALGQSGTATVTIFVNDNVLTASSSFDVTVGEANTAPNIFVAASLATDSYTPLTDVPVVVTDKESRPDDLMVEAFSYNQAVLPTANIQFSGSGSNRMVNLVPVAGKSGSVTVTYSVSDGKAVTHRTCQVSVSAGTAPKAKLAVHHRRLGTTVPALDGADLTVGAKYSIKAVPASTDVFMGWGGGVTSKLTSISFVMASNLVLEAVFTNSPYPEMKGSYNGLFHEASAVRHETSGNFTVVPTDKGAYSAKLTLGGHRYSFSGAIDLSGRATNVVVRRGATPLTVEMEFGDEHPTQVFGRVTDGSWEAPLAGDRTAWNKLTNAVPFLGSYTIVFPGQDDASGPEGSGFGTVKVDAAGLATLAGTLADGSKIALRMPVAQGGQWPLYVPLYSSTGSVLGWMTVANRVGDDMSGLVSWIRPAAPKSKLFPAGFTADTFAVASLFVPPVAPSGRTLALSAAQVAFTGGDLIYPFSNPVVFEDTGKVVNLGVTPLTLTITKTTGLFTGSVTDPGTGKALRYSGAIFQKANSASGFLLGPTRSARVTVSDQLSN